MRTSLKADLVNHPVRLRILGAIGAQRLTPKQIGEAMPDVPQATLYRQINRLQEGGLLAVVGQRQVHGVVESTYAVKRGAAHLTRQEFAAMSPDEHRSCQALLGGAAAHALSRYFGQPGYDTTRDGMTYFAANLALTNEGAQQFRSDLLDLIQTYARESDETRMRRVLTVSFIPDSQP